MGKGAPNGASAFGRIRSAQPALNGAALDLSLGLESKLVLELGGLLFQFSRRLELNSPQGIDRCSEPAGPDHNWLVVLRLPARLLASHGPVEPSLLLGRFVSSCLSAVLQELSSSWQVYLSHPSPTLGSDTETTILFESAA